MPLSLIIQSNNFNLHLQSAINFSQLKLHTVNCGKVVILSFKNIYKTKG